MNNLRIEILEERKDVSSLLFLIEVPLQDGKGHMIEHLIAKDLLPILASHGFQFYAESGLGYTLFHITGVEHLSHDLLLQIYQGIFNKKFSEQSFEAEKNVVVEEIKKDYEDPHKYIGERMYALMLGSSVLGDASQIHQLRFSHVVRFYREYYITGNTVIVTNHDAYVRSPYLKLISDGRRAVTFTSRPIAVTEQRENIQRSHFLMTLGSLRVDYYTLVLLASLFHTRIFSTLCKDKGTVYDISCWSDFRTNFFYVDFSSDPRTFSENKDIVLRLFSEFLQKPLSEQDIIAARKNIYAQIKLTRDDIRNKIYEYVFFVKHSQKEFFLQSLDYLKKISSDDLQKTCKLLAASPKSILVIEPSTVA